MQIKKRYIKEEIERLEKLVNHYEGLISPGDNYNSEISNTFGKISSLEWVLGFADD